MRPAKCVVCGEPGRRNFCDACAASYGRTSASYYYPWTAIRWAARRARWAMRRNGEAAIRAWKRGGKRA